MPSRLEDVTDSAADYDYGTGHGVDFAVVCVRARTGECEGETLTWVQDIASPYTCVRSCCVLSTVLVRPRHRCPCRDDYGGICELTYAEDGILDDYGAGIRAIGR